MKNRILFIVLVIITSHDYSLFSQADSQTVLDSLTQIIERQKDSINTLSLTSHYSIYSNTNLEPGYIYGASFTEPIFEEVNVTYPNVWINNDTTCQEIYPQEIIVRPSYKRLVRPKNVKYIESLEFFLQEVPAIIDTVFLVSNTESCTSWGTQVFEVQNIKTEGSITEWKKLTDDYLSEVGLLQRELESIGYLKPHYELNVLDRPTRKAILKFKKDNALTVNEYINWRLFGKVYNYKN